MKNREQALGKPQCLFKIGEKACCLSRRKNCSLRAHIVEASSISLSPRARGVSSIPLLLLFQPDLLRWAQVGACGTRNFHTCSLKRIFPDGHAAVKNGLRARGRKLCEA